MPARSPSPAAASTRARTPPPPRCARRRRSSALDPAAGRASSARPTPIAPSPAIGVTPVVGVVPPDLPLVPNPAEVADWFEAPLAFVLDPANQQPHERRISRAARAIITRSTGRAATSGARPRRCSSTCRGAIAMKLDPHAWLERPGIKRLLNALDAEAGRRALRRRRGARRAARHAAERPRPRHAASRRDEVVRRLEAARIKAVPTGIDHGTITAVASGTRGRGHHACARDVSTDGRRATVAFTDDWTADAARRDFTINALYADPLSGELIDYFGGARRSERAPRPLHRRAARSASPRTICASCASSASTPASARRARSRTRSTPAPRAPTT